MGYVLGPHQRLALIGEADADELAEHFVGTIDSELGRRRRGNMTLSPTTIVESLVYILKLDEKLVRFIADDSLVTELRELVQQRLDATRRVIKTSSRAPLEI